MTEHNAIPEIRIDGIMKLLPHRYPFLLVDRLKDVVPGESGIGVKNVTINEPFFQGHFPDNPIMPGVLQIEAMAQTAAVVMSSEDETLAKRNMLFMNVDKVKFRNQVRPGDTVRMEVTNLRVSPKMVKQSGKAFVGDVLCAEAEWMCLVGSAN